MENGPRVFTAAIPFLILGMGMTEEQIELVVEREMDRLDPALLFGKISQAEYDAEVEQLDAWAREQKKVIR